MPREPRYMAIEAPDDTVKIDFLGAGKRQGFTVKISVENNANGRTDARVEVIACDDCSSILLDTELRVPAEDRRR